MLGQFIHDILHNTFFIQYGLIGLFLNGMFSSFIPIPTEVTSSALILAGANTTDIFFALNIGSIVGGFIAYYIGYNAKLLQRFRKIPEKKYESKSIKMMNKYGWTVIIFFSPWIPILGDVASIMAGTQKFSIKKYAIAMIIGKTIKSIAIVFLGGFVLQSLLQFH